MADKKLKVDLEVDASKAKSGFKEAAAEAKKLSTGFEDTESAGKQMARALTQVADVIESELAGAKSAAERLGEALGPEFAADAERGEAAVEELVAQLRTAGLTYDDIRADAEQLADAIKRLDDTGKNLNGVSTAAKTVEGDFKRVAGEADNTRSVVANFAGNAAQEIPGITGAMGPLNMAIGQFAEYASEGNIKLGNFIAAGAGLAVVSAALVGITGQMKKVAEVKAFDKSQIEDYRQAIVEADGAVGTYEKTLRDAGKVAVSLFSDWKIDDFTPMLAAAGLSVEQFATLVEGGATQIDAWGAAAEAAGGDMKLIEAVTRAATDQAEKWTEAQKLAAASLQFFAAETTVSAAGLEGFNAVVAGTVEILKLAEGGLGDTADQAAKTRDKIDRLRDSVSRLQDILSNRDAYDNAIQAQNELIWFNQIAIDTARNQKATEEEKAEALDASKEALRRSIDETLTYIDTVGGIPPSKETEIKALLDEGKYQEAEAWLAHLARARTAFITAKGQGSLGFMKDDLGGHIPAGEVHEVAEKRAEFVNGVLVAGPADVTSGAETGRILGRMGSATSGGSSMNITINMPPGSNGQDVVNAIRKYERTNGTAWRS